MNTITLEILNSGLARITARIDGRSLRSIECTPKPTDIAMAIYDVMRSEFNGLMLSDGRYEEKYIKLNPPAKEIYDAAINHEMFYFKTRPRPS